MGGWVSWTKSTSGNTGWMMDPDLILLLMASCWESTWRVKNVGQIEKEQGQRPLLGMGVCYLKLFMMYLKRNVRFKGSLLKPTWDLRILSSLPNERAMWLICSTHLLRERSKGLQGHSSWIHHHSYRNRRSKMVGLRRGMWESRDRTTG